MDFYLKENNYKLAAQVAIEVMLQEFNDNQLTLAFSLFSCLKYFSTLNNLKNVEDSSSSSSENQPDESAKKVNWQLTIWTDWKSLIKNEFLQAKATGIVVEKLVYGRSFWFDKLFEISRKDVVFRKFKHTFRVHFYKHNESTSIITFDSNTCGWLSSFLYLMPFLSRRKQRGGSIWEKSKVQVKNDTILKTFFQARFGPWNKLRTLNYCHPCFFEDLWTYHFWQVFESHWKTRWACK